jgi:tetratricopeptide (TPR) repeat protein
LSAVPFLNWQRAHQYKLASVDDVLHWNQPNDADPKKYNALYGVSWALVHWLYNTHAEQFGQFQRMLAVGTDPDIAWKQCCRGLERGADAVLERYYEEGSSRVMSMELPPVRSEASERPLSPAEVHLLRAQLSLAARTVLAHTAKAIQEDPSFELKAALKAEPDNVDALWSSFAGKSLPDNLAQAERSCAAHPDNAHAWLWKASALNAMKAQGPEEEAAIRRVIALDPGESRALRQLGIEYLRQNRFALAYSYALRAMRLSPWNPGYVNLVAATLVGLHRCEEAVKTQLRAIDMLPERASLAVRREFEGMLTQYQIHCAAPLLEGWGEERPPSDEGPDGGFTPAALSEQPASNEGHASDGGLTPIPLIDRS